MSKDLIIAILALAFAGCCGALLVVIAKLDEQKKMTAEERDNYKAALSLHNTTAEQFGIEQRYLESKINFEDGYHKYAIKEEIERRVCAEAERDELQDRLSSLLCPMNDHVWEVSDAYRGECRCKKCGRAKDA